jgi:hypothetical protein
MANRRLPARRPKLPGEVTDVSRIEFENIESVVLANAQRLIRLEGKFEALSREIAELAKIIRALRSG